MIKSIKKSKPNLRILKDVIIKNCNIEKFNKELDNINIYDLKDINKFNSIMIDIKLELDKLILINKKEILYFGIINDENILTGMMLNINEGKLTYIPLYKNMNNHPNINSIGETFTEAKFVDIYKEKSILKLNSKYEKLDDSKIKINFWINNDKYRYGMQHDFKHDNIKLFLITSNNTIFNINKENINLIGE